jgi:hypothetical protein
MEHSIFTSYKPGEFETLIDTRLSKILKEELSKITGNQKPEKTIYTRQETAAFLDISLPTLNEYTKQGFITACRLGHKVRYRLVDIEQALTRIKTK